MNSRQERGQAGEQAAEALLRRSGLRILERNWRCRSLELDIVAQDDDMLVFVEVRTRSEGGLALPVDTLNPTKCRHFVRAARAYLAEKKAWDQPCRFDIVCVLDTGTTLELEHLRHVNLTRYTSEALDRRHTAWQPW